MMHKRLIVTALLIVAFIFAVSVVSAETILLNSFKFTFSGRMYDTNADTTTFSYFVEGTGVPSDLSHFDLDIPDCEIELVVVDWNPKNAVEFGIDPTTGVDGIKWGEPLKTDQNRLYSITYAGDVPIGKVTAPATPTPTYTETAAPTKTPAATETPTTEAPPTSTETRGSLLTRPSS